MPSGADLEYARMLLAAGSPTSTAGLDGAALELLGDSIPSHSLLAPIEQGRPNGNRVLATGDSVTQQSYQESANYMGLSWFTLACALSGQKIRFAGNTGIAGNTSTQLLARFQADVIDRKPSVAVINIGVNDIGNGVPFTTYQSNILNMILLCRFNKIKPVLCTINPNSSSGRHATISKWNHWLKRYANAQGIDLIDMHSVLIDPAGTSGGYKAAFDGDGTHPNAAGALAMAQEAIRVLAPLLPSYGPPLLEHDSDPNNILGAGGCFIADTNADGLADGWSVYSGNGGGRTYGPIQTDALVKGRMQRLTAAASASIFVVSKSANNAADAVCSPGDRLAFSGVLTTDGGVPSNIAVNFNGSSGGGTPWGSLTGAFTRAVLYQEFTVGPVSPTSVEVLFQIAAGTGTADLGQVSVYNLTRLGIV